jgi:hypothetical protein
VRYLERAKIYVDRSLRSHPRDFASMNELANILQEQEGTDLSERARGQFEASAKTEPKQQRALYWLGYIAMGHEKYHAAENYFTHALGTDIWEVEKSSAERRWDLFYNRSCTRSRLGEKAQDPTSQKTYEEQGLQDLEAACPKENQPILKNLDEDIESGNDLGWLNARRGDAIQQIRKRLST